jgi:Ca-activated chloride channel family protein
VEQARVGDKVKINITSAKVQRNILLLILSCAAAYCLIEDDCSLLTPDQSAYRYYQSGDYVAAAERYADPMWKGAALFRQGEFKQAAGVFAGYDTAESAYNHGNALVMQGKYEEAAARYERALELHPDWEEAEVNLEIARARADLLKQEGGVGTGGKLGADEIVFSKGKSDPAAGDETVEGNKKLSDSDFQAMWLRNVQTKPADFLRSKFAYQHALGNQSENEKSPE